MLCGTADLKQIHGVRLARKSRTDMPIGSEDVLKRLESAAADVNMYVWEGDHQITAATVRQYWWPGGDDSWIRFVRSWPVLFAAGWFLILEGVVMNGEARDAVCENDGDRGCHLRAVRGDVHDRDDDLRLRVAEATHSPVAAPQREKTMSP